MDRDRFEQGSRIAEWMDRLVARREEWQSRFHAAAAETIERSGALREHRAVVVAADWSWECAEGLPPILALLSSTAGLETRVFSRDENLDVALWIDREDPLSLPRLAIIGPHGRRIERWGPRPRAAEAVLREREARRPMSERMWRLREWYVRDGGRSGVDEVRRLLESFESDRAAST